MTLKFVFIVICFAIACLSYFFCHSKKDWAWLTGGLFFTVGADYFLVLHDNHLPGVAVFCFVHVCYILRVFPTHKYKFALLAVPILVFFVFANNALFVLAGIYATLFIFNIFINIRFCKKNRSIIITGLVLFALCDINVMLFNLPRHLDIPVIFPWAFNLIWVFYLPSQLLLAVSAVKFNKLNNK